MKIWLPHFAEAMQPPARIPDMWETTDRETAVGALRRLAERP